MKNIIFTCLFLTLSYSFLFSQIQIFIDDRVEYKLVEFIEIEKRKEKEKGANIPEKPEEIISKTGYRIQICFDRDKSIVEKARTKFSNMYPKMGAYITPEPPYFSLTVGDFQRKEEAQAVKDKIFGKFAITNIQLGPVNPPQKAAKIK